MYKICLKDESLTRQRVMEKALLRLMQKQSYEQIAVNSLCTYADVPRNAFYRYFSTKDDVLLAMIDHTLEDLNYLSANGKALPCSVFLTL